nr:unnamed protein product [Digitaria exilis]
MAMEAEAMGPRPFQAGGGGAGEVAGRPAPAFLATERDRPVDPEIWSDEKRMKLELVAWAKAVASMAAAKQSTSSSASMPSSSWPTVRRR